MTRSFDILVSHRHPIEFVFGTRSVKICARCSGALLGFGISSLLVPLLFKYLMTSVSVPLQLFVSVLLVIPVAVDWLTQKWGLRESTNKMRLLTGFLEGVGISLVALSSLSIGAKILIVGSLGISIYVVGLAATRTPT